MGEGGDEAELIRKLMPLERSGAEIIWDERIDAGDLVDMTIQKWLNECDILLAIVSDDFLQSAYCTDFEVKNVLERRQKGEDVTIIPFYLSPCEWKQIPWLSETRGLPSPDCTFTEIANPGDRTKALLDLREHLRRRVRRLRKEV